MIALWALAAVSIGAMAFGPLEPQYLLVAPLNTTQVHDVRNGKRFHATAGFGSKTGETWPGL